jgi:hypothetical protein
MIMAKKYAAGFTSNYENNGRVETLAEKHGLNQGEKKPWIIRLISREDDKIDGKPIQIARYELSFKLREQMDSDCFYEEVYKTLYKEKAEAVRLLIPGGKTIYYTKGYIEAAYRRVVLGEKPEVPAETLEEAEA